MARARRSKGDDSAARTALLEAAQAVMVEEGYAAVTTRRVAARAGVNNGLVYYYFGTMDELFIELVRRGGEHNLARLNEVLDSDQPLWGLWDLLLDYSGNAMTTELLALANHRKAIRAEFAAYSTRFRTLQAEKLAAALDRYGVDPERWPPATVVFLLASVSRSLLTEQAFGVAVGHESIVALVEDQIRALEGDRRAVPVP